MVNTQIGDLSDLVLNRCPLGCRNCAEVWINETTNHRIVCKCVCKHKETLARTWEPQANAESSLSPEKTEENGIQ
jgi:hypothetical protein